MQDQQENQEKEYESAVKQLAWTTWWEGYKLGKQQEKYHPVAKRSAKEKFEIWWKQNK